jgi:hypothetical protein
LALLPIDLSPAVISVAGGALGVEQTARTLSASTDVRFVAVRDRDLLSDEAVTALTTAIPELFVWPKRTLENELLDPPLVLKTLERAGANVPVEDVANRLLELAERQKEEILADLTRQELEARHEFASKGANRLEKLRGYIEETVRVGREKLDEFDDVLSQTSATLDGRWAADHVKLMDGKRALREFREFTPFENPAGLITAIMATLRDHPELMPSGLVAFRERLQALALATRADEAPD